MRPLPLGSSAAKGLSNPTNSATFVKGTRSSLHLGPDSASSWMGRRFGLRLGPNWTDLDILAADTLTCSLEWVFLPMLSCLAALAGSLNDLATAANYSYSSSESA